MHALAIQILIELSEGLISPLLNGLLGTTAQKTDNKFQNLRMEKGSSPQISPSKY